MDKFKKAHDAFMDAWRTNRMAGTSRIVGAPVKKVTSGYFQLVFYNTLDGPIIVQLTVWEDKYQVFVNNDGFKI